MIENCDACGRQRTNHRQTILLTGFPSRPRSSEGADLFQTENKLYLVVVDRFSGYSEVAKLTSTTTMHWLSFKSIFSRHGIPEVVHSDDRFRAQICIWAQKACTEESKEENSCFLNDYFAVLIMVKSQEILFGCLVFDIDLDNDWITELLYMFWDMSKSFICRFQNATFTHAFPLGRSFIRKGDGMQY